MAATNFLSATSKPPTAGCVLSVDRRRMRCVDGDVFVDAWALGWTLENNGSVSYAGDSEEDFTRQTLRDSWGNDIPVLVEMFNSLK